MKKLLILLPLALLLMACPQKKKGLSAPGLKINLASKWRIIGFENNKVKKTLKNNSYIELRPENKGTIYIGCNTGNFKYSLDTTNTSIKTEAMMSTRMYCKNISETESILFSSLKKIKKYHYDGELLELTGENTIIKCKAF